MKAGDLCKVIKRHTHRPCQYGHYVIILGPLNQQALGADGLKDPKWFEAINQTTGKWHHHHIDDLELVKPDK